MKKYRIFVACDYAKTSKIKEIINKTKTSKLEIGYKFGLEFFNSKKVRYFVSKLKKKIVFADLKLHDIPNTCASTVKVIKDLKVNYLTIHVSAGLEALKASKKVSGKTKLIGVTTLTSLDNKSLKMIGYSKSVKKLVIHQAKLASKAKLDALVCSPHDVKYVKKRLPFSGEPYHLSKPIVGILRSKPRVNRNVLKLTIQIYCIYHYLIFDVYHVLE